LKAETSLLKRASQEELFIDAKRNFIFNPFYKISNTKISIVAHTESTDLPSYLNYFSSKAHKVHLTEQKQEVICTCYKSARFLPMHNVHA
jgi:hypothetical protein